MGGHVVQQVYLFETGNCFELIHRDMNRTTGMETSQHLDIIHDRFQKTDRLLLGQWSRKDHVHMDLHGWFGAGQQFFNCGTVLGVDGVLRRRVKGRNDGVHLMMHQRFLEKEASFVNNVWHCRDQAGGRLVHAEKKGPREDRPKESIHGCQQ
jgi:hypothetical protein